MLSPERYTRVGSTTSVEAVVVDPTNLVVVADWASAEVVEEAKSYLRIPTRKYVLHAYVGDVVIKEVIDGRPHFMISDAEVFAQKYTLLGMDSDNES